MIHVKKSGGSVIARIPLTPSKSITNRFHIINALSGNNFIASNESHSTDSIVLRNALDLRGGEIDLNDAGTSFRFLTSFFSIRKGDYVLTGSERMKKRPIGPLVMALNELGANIEYTDKAGYPPLKIIGKPLIGGRITIEATQSSQFVSSLLLIGPLLKKGLELVISGKRNSTPYILMTLWMMRKFGINVEMKGNQIHIPNGNYSTNSVFRIENDWSSASFWYLIAALSEEAEIILENLSLDSVQGDKVISVIMKRFDVDSVQVGNDVIVRKKLANNLPLNFDYDFSDCPDLVIPVSFLCAILKIQAVFRGVANLRIKESDRLEALKEELEKTGSEVILSADIIQIKPGSSHPSSINFNSHNDHRMVMAAACLSLKLGHVTIDDSLPVRKSYPEFWDQLRIAGFELDIT